MKKIHFALTTVIAVLLLSNLAIADTKNLTTQQYRVNAAQDRYNSEKSKYDHATDLIKDQKKRVAQLETNLKNAKALLEKRKVERANLDADLAKLKSVLDEEERILNIIWDKTHR